MRYALLIAMFLTAAPTAAFSEWPINTAGTLLVMNKGDDTVTLVALESGEHLKTLPTGTEPHEGACSPDGRVAVIANTDYNSDSGHTLTVIDVPGRAVARTLPLGYAHPHGIAFLPDGERVIVTVEGAEAVALVEVTSGAVEAIATPGYPCHMVRLSPDGRRAWATSISLGALVELDLVEREMAGVVATGDGAEGFDVTPDGAGVWVGNRAADTVSIVDAATLEVAASIPAPGFPIRLSFARSGAVALVSCARASTLRVIDTATRQETGAIDMPDGAVPIGILVAPDGRHAFVANTETHTVTVVDIEAMAIAATVNAGNTPDGMALAVTP